MYCTQVFYLATWSQRTVFSPSYVSAAVTWP